jgi:integrase
LARSYKALNALRLKNDILPVFGETRLKAITSGKVESWLLKMNATPRVKNTALQVLRTMLGEAERLELIASNPVKRVLPVVQTRKVRDLFSPQEIRQLFDPAAAAKVWAEDLKAHLACLLAANSAMRAGEILGLQVESLHIEGDVPWVGVDRSWDRKELKGTKTGINRKVPIPAWLGTRLAAIAPPAGFLFSDDNGTSPLPYFRLRKALQRALEAIGISVDDQKARGLGLHAFRHWVNTSLRGKVSDNIIRAMTGHVSEEMTEHYTSHRLEDLRPIVGVIEAVFENNTAEARE